MFCDLVGFTAASEQVDPEDVRARARGRTHGACGAQIERHGGMVEKFIGDAVMAVFGVPAAHEDDAGAGGAGGAADLRAIDELKGGAARRLQLRVGVNTGSAFVRLGASRARGRGS